MKKLLLLLIAVLVILPGAAQAQTDSLSRAEINRISNSVVLVLALDSNGNPSASGSGTIIDPNGIIYTNRHVVEGASDFAILTQESVGEPAKLAYYATPILIHPDVDFAELQIDRDANGNSINANRLNLPVIAIANAVSGIGDRIFVFGYPSLGDAHLVMTSGSITTIENDTLNGARIPYWYQTDAQISPGNSGGLVVNSAGEMIGIPTEVRSEERTLGRLGSILTMSAINAALASQQSVALPTQLAPRTQTPPINKGSNSNQGQQLTIAITNVEHNVTYDNALGMMIHTSANAIGYNGVPLRAAVFGFWDDGSPIQANNRAASDSRSTDGQITVQQVVTPGYDNTVWDDMWFFIPYDNFPDGRTGDFPAYMEAQIGVDGEGFSAYSDPSNFTYTYPDKQLVVDITNVEHNVTLNNLTGMKVHSHINALGYQGETLRVALFVYWSDGTPIKGANDSPADNRTTSGYLTVQDTITPSHDNSEWADFWFFLPYDYFPTGLKGDQDAYAEVEIGLDAQTFSSWSLEAPFTLNYSS
ncbi:MAG: trypsin-like serine protease [Chloroflexi bacterium]|nr:trypsin-like serine protease [Chloroflexota bacterium]